MAGIQKYKNNNNIITDNSNLQRRADQLRKDKNVKMTISHPGVYKHKSGQFIYPNWA